MAYIGNIPAVQYASFSKQTLTADSSTVAFTLDNAVANENELEVFVNNVRQEPGSGNAYTASGTTLTMSAAPTTGDSFYVIFQGKATQTVTPGSGTVTNAMLAGSIANAKLANSSITLNSSAISLGGSSTIANTPSFFARVGTTTAFSGASDTKVAADTEEWDTDNAYDSSTNYRFTVPAGEDGKYVIIGSAEYDVTVENEYGRIRFHKNGSSVNNSEVRLVLDSAFATIMKTVHIFDLSAGDYIEMYIRTLSSGGTYVAGKTSFQGYKLIGV